MDIGGIDDLFFGGNKDLQEEIRDQSEVWISWEEWSWRSTDKYLDEQRNQNNLKPISAQKRQRDLELHLASVDRQASKQQANATTLPDVDLSGF